MTESVRWTRFDRFSFQDHKSMKISEPKELGEGDQTDAKARSR